MNHLGTSLAACCSTNKTAPIMIDLVAQVVDEVFDPVPFAHIWIPDIQVGTTTDENGYFTIPNVPSSANVIFDFQTVQTVKVAGQITSQVQINTALQGDEVIINAPRDNNLKYFGMGLLAVVLVYAISRPGDKKTEAKSKPSARSEKTGVKKKTSTRPGTKTTNKKTVKASV